MTDRPAEHPFHARPHRTFIGLSLPVLLSLTAEPLTGLIDTAFVARLGAAQLAGLGVSTALLTGAFWVFNFLSIGTQTQVARSLGAVQRDGVARATGTAVALSLAIGATVAALLLPALPFLAGLFGAEGDVLAASTTYLTIRILGAPAILASHAVFGAFRGLQDMKTPLAIAVVANSANIVLDAVLIHGAGPIPAYGIAGAAWASTASQVAAALLSLAIFKARHGLRTPRNIADVAPLFAIGRDLVMRTGMLLLFLMYTTRVANLISVEAGAVHQAVRTVWIFTAFLLDAYASTAQSLVSYFLGHHDLANARRVARLACAWALGTGIATAAVMLGSSALVSRALVGTPPSQLFLGAWLIAALVQPINAISFVTDGIHWGTGDYRYLRNAMLLASSVGLAALGLLEHQPNPSLQQVWMALAGWVTLRALFGLGRIWPVATGPLARPPSVEDPAHGRS